MQKISRILWSVVLLALGLAGSVRSQDQKPELIESLTVGAVTYTNVQLMHRTKADLFIRHAGGVINVKVKNLDKSTQLQLGYHLTEPDATNALSASQSTLPGMEINPRYEEFAEKVTWESREFIERLSPNVLHAAGGVGFVLYLFFCGCCRMICRKAGQTRLALVWFPLLKQVPLFRAAGMSPWWILTNFLPPVFLITYLTWSFKIAEARGKGPIIGFLLLLPGVNLFAFLYLAFADRSERNEVQNSGKGKLFSLQEQSHRNAA